MRKGRVSATHCCAFLDISATTFGRLIEDGVFARQSPSDGFDLKLVVRACCALWRRQAAGRADPEQDRVLSSARARHALAAAEEREIKTKLMRDEVIAVPDARAVMTDAIIQARSFFMSVIPGSVAEAVERRIPEAAESDIYGLVESRVREGLEQFTDGLAPITAGNKLKRSDHLRLAEVDSGDGDRHG